MKNFAKIMSALALVLVVLTLASCGSISKDYADKVNNAAKDGNNLTLDQVKGDLGSDYSGAIVAGAGVLVWTKKDGDTTKSITITFVSSKATLAAYAEVEAKAKE